MNIFLLSLGSNYNKEENMNKAQLLLNSYFSKIVYSEMHQTEPLGEGFVLMFYNQLAIAYTSKDEKEILHILKSLELELGRDCFDKSKGIIKIDLDILAVDKRILKENDFNRPYIYPLLQSFNLSSNYAPYFIYLNEYLKYSESRRTCI